MPQRQSAMKSREARRRLALAAVALVACCFLVPEAFTGPMVRTSPPRGQPAVAMHATGEYTGFVPDLQRRTLMNLVVVAASAVPVVVFLGGFIQYFFPPSGGGSGGVTLCGDIDGVPITLSEWVKNHKNNDRELVQGLKGDATYLVSTPDGVKDFGICAVCTHLGCIVPWVVAVNKFCCPCHGSQYDENGKVVRGPAPLSLALAHTVITDDGKVAVKPWSETDFRTGLKPWWEG